MNKIKLSTENLGTFDNPTEQQISRAISELYADGGFIVLERLNGDMVQAAGNLIEYRMNDRHFRSVTEEIDPILVGSILIAFLKGDEKWMQMTTWTDVTEEIDGYRGNPLWSSGVIKLIAILGTLSLAVFLFRKCK